MKGLAGETRDTAQGLESALAEVRGRVRSVMARSPLAESELEIDEFLGWGKMLRSRLLLRLAPDCGAAPDRAIRAAAAVEMVHAASLLHDDVIDGGRLRRSAPAFWVAHGVSASILVGDLLLCEAIALLRRGGDDDLLGELITLTSAVCRAEVEQELVLRGAAADWDTAVRLARQKTGALFAFAAVAACESGGTAARLRAALREVGFRAGTAYQLADDVLDAAPDERRAGKTLGRDRARRKVTAATARPDAAARVQRLIEAIPGEALRRLDAWPAAAAAWEVYWQDDFLPAAGRNLALGAAGVPA